MAYHNKSDKPDQAPKAEGQGGQKMERHVQNACKLQLGQVAAACTLLDICEDRAAELSWLSSVLLEVHVPDSITMQPAQDGTGDNWLCLLC